MHISQNSGIYCFGVIIMDFKPVQKRKDLPDKEEIFDFTEQIDSVVSATECTGLMQIPPQSEEEEESYNDIYPVFNETEKEHRK